MTFPFEILESAQREAGLVVALLIGFAFGFVLERAGFGNARKLAAQFYLTDMTVLKVMFSAIVTAMGGLLVASGLGLTDLTSISQSIASWTWIWPMLAGGFVLGVGFLVSGYCPGTSIVSAASGHVDGAVTFAGVVAGSFVYNLLLGIPAVTAFHDSGSRGPLFLYELLGVPAPIVGFAVCLMAIGAFVGAEKIEAAMRARRLGADSAASVDDSRPRRFAFAVFGSLALLAVGLLAVPRPGDETRESRIQTITAEALARRVVEEPWSVRIVDLRGTSAFAAARIPTSENVDSARLEELGLEQADPSRDLVVVAEGVLSVMPRELASFRGRVIALEGGWASWQSFALDMPAPPDAEASERERELYAFRAALNGALTNQRAALPVAAAPAGSYTPKPKKGGGCDA